MIDTLYNTDDQDPATAGDVFIEYSLLSGTMVVSGRWPPASTVGLEGGHATQVGVLAGIVPRQPFEVRVHVFDWDSALAGTHDFLGAVSLYFSNIDDAASRVVHIQEGNGIRVGVSIVDLSR